MSAGLVATLRATGVATSLGKGDAPV